MEYMPLFCCVRWNFWLDFSFRRKYNPFSNEVDMASSSEFQHYGACNFFTMGSSYENSTVI